MRIVRRLRTGVVRLALGAALGVALGSALVACGPTVSRTRVEKGETITTGDAAYDTFFREIAEVKYEAEKAGADLSDATRPLSDAIRAPGKSAAPSDAVRVEAKKLQMSGTLLHLDLVPETKLVTSGKPDAPSEKLLGAAEQTAKGALAIARRAGEVLVRITDLEKRRGDLVAGAGTSFPDESKRAEITRELASAEGVLKAAREAGEKHGGAASRLALDLAMALETGAGSGVAAAAKKLAKPLGGGKPAGTGTAGPAKPKGDDFDK